jgi:hypothetical protein
MAEIICRHAQDDFFALMTAQGMEDAGCCVFSVTHVPSAPSRLGWVVWGRYQSTETTPVEIDKCIERRLFPSDQEHANE